MTDKEQKKHYCDLFNAVFKVGQEVTLKNTSHAGIKKVRYKAWQLPSGEAVAMFEGITGAFSINPSFVEYPSNVLAP